MKKIFSLIALVLAGSIYAQEQGADTTQEKLASLQGKIAGIEESYLETQSTVSKLAKIKFSGYLQAQYRLALDTAGNNDASGNYIFTPGEFQGGKLTNGVSNLFHVRRGRLKLTYEQPLTQMVLQIDVTQGGVGIKDAYLALKEPWLKSIGLKAGVFDRPFGYEISYSSSSRESPERSRLFQTLFPGERDIGAQLEVAPAEKFGLLSYLNLKGGLFNGVRENLAENDGKKDFIGRLGFTVPLMDLNLSIDGGVSAYMGSVTNTDTTSTVWTSKSDTTYPVTYYYDNTTHSKIDSSYSRTITTTKSGLTRGYLYEITDNKFMKKDSAAGQYNKQVDRQYMGGDLQVYYDFPVLGGLKIMTEVIQGKQPGSASSSGFYNPGRPSNSAVYLRNFMGYYVMGVQNVFKKNQLVVKYDVYDPNTDVAASNFMLSPDKKSFAGGLSGADVSFSTLGLGWIYHWDENLKFVFYYEKISNEKISAADASPTAGIKIFAKDIADDMLTLRAQYKF